MDKKVLGKFFLALFLVFIFAFSFVSSFGEENEPVTLIEPIEDIFIPKYIPYEIYIPDYFYDDYFDIDFLEIEFAEVKGIDFFVEEEYLYLVLNEEFVNATKFKFLVSDGRSKVNSNEMTVYEVYNGDSYEVTQEEYNAFLEDFARVNSPAEEEESGVVAISCEELGGEICNSNEFCDGFIIEGYFNCCEGECVNSKEVNEEESGLKDNPSNFLKENVLFISLVIGGILFFIFLVVGLIFLFSKLKRNPKGSADFLENKINDPVKEYIKNLNLEE